MENNQTMKDLTAKEKAKELVDSIIDIMPCLVNQTGKLIIDHAKQCALIAVREIRELLNHLPTHGYGMEYQDDIEYYQEVESEIEKL